MKKISLILTILIVPLLLTACTKKPDSAMDGQSGTQQQDTSNQGAVPNSVSGTIMDLFKLGVPMKCTASYDQDDGKFDMTTYVSGKNSYSEIMMEAEGQSINTYSIVNGDWIYTWGDMMDGGTKMQMSEIEKLGEDMETEDAEAQEQAAQYQKEFDYQCMPWVVDSSKFDPPSDIEFRDMTQMMKDMKEAVDNMDLDSMKQSACGSCEMLPNETAKAECKANLGCE